MCPSTVKSSLNAYEQFYHQKVHFFLNNAVILDNQLAATEFIYIHLMALAKGQASSRLTGGTV